MLAAAALNIICGLGKTAHRGLGSLPSVYSAVELGTPLHPGASGLKDRLEAFHPQQI